MSTNDHPQIELKDGTHTTDPRLDRLKHWDERNMQHLTRELVGASLPTKKITWRIDDWNDQGNMGACVGFSFTNEANAYPYVHHRDNEYAKNWYFDAQRIDYWPGGEYPGASPQYAGTAVIAGAKVGQSRGYFQSYKWALSVEEAAAALQLGPIVLGTDWYQNMFYPDSRFGELTCTGSLAGGHAILIRGWYPAGSYITNPGTGKSYRLSQPYFRLRNSWSKGWGMYGDCMIRLEDMRRLHSAGGEFCVPVGRKHVA